MLNALEVPILCAPIPIAKPRCYHVFIFKALSTNGAKIAPSIPVLTAKIAVSVGDTPIRSAIPIAMGAVTDLGYMAPVMLLSAPNRVAISTALTIETRPPAHKETISGMELPFKLLRPL
jgi:hypothetical protein